MAINITQSELDALERAFQLMWGEVPGTGAAHKNREIMTYWLPVDGYPDIFIHFSIGMTSDNDKMPEVAQNSQ